MAGAFPSVMGEADEEFGDLAADVAGHFLDFLAVWFGEDGQHFVGGDAGGLFGSSFRKALNFLEFREGRECFLIGFGVGFEGFDGAVRLEIFELFEGTVVGTFEAGVVAGEEVCEGAGFGIGEGVLVFFAFKEEVGFGFLGAEHVPAGGEDAFEGGGFENAFRAALGEEFVSQSVEIVELMGEDYVGRQAMTAGILVALLRGGEVFGHLLGHFGGFLSAAGAFGVDPSLTVGVRVGLGRTTGELVLGCRFCLA